MSLRHRVATPVLLLAAAVAATLTAVFGIALPARAATPTYTALGDSYSSGTGTRQYYPDSGSCQRSPLAYPVLDAARLGAALTHAACAGATVSGVLNGQLASLNASTSYVTLTVGANDIGWSGVITQCALPWPFTCESQIASAEDQIRTVLPGRLDQLYSRIRQLAPAARVVVVSYPRLFNGEECNLLTRISPTEQAELNAGADLLATTTRDRAAAHGFGFVDARGPFTGHAVCDDIEWVNGLSNPIGESYHPNPAGHTAYAGLVESALRSAAAARG